MFYFQCLTDNDISDGIECNWTKGSVSIEQNGVEGGAQFSLRDPTSNDAGVYTCSLINNSVTIESVSINITAGTCIVHALQLHISCTILCMLGSALLVSHQSLTRSPCSRHVFSQCVQPDNIGSEKCVEMDSLLQI